MMMTYKLTHKIQTRIVPESYKGKQQIWSKNWKIVDEESIGEGRHGENVWWGVGKKDEERKRRKQFIIKNTKNE